MSDADLLREEASHVLGRRALWRSRSYTRLLEYLVECSVEGRAPKEIEVAREVFDKPADFDPAQDSIVRVYAHNLRRKLERYYENEGSARPHRLGIARGEYRLVLTSAAGDDDESMNLGSAPPAAERRPFRTRLAAAVAACSALIGVAVGFAVRHAVDELPPSPYAELAASAIWSPFFDDDLPLLVAVGDYYIFGELDERGGVRQLVREFGINSTRDLDELLKSEPHLQARYVDLDLTYLPRGAASALANVLHVLHESAKPVRVVAASELVAADLKSHHLIYLGYVSGLARLEEIAFASSALMVGVTYDELVDRRSGRTFASQAGTHAYRGRYTDYGMISTFPGPGGNQLLVAAGMRDEGLMQVAQALSTPALLRAIERALPDDSPSGPPAVEMLYEVTGLRRANLDATLVHTGPLSYEQIWR